MTPRWETQSEDTGRSTTLIWELSMVIGSSKPVGIGETDRETDGESGGESGGM